MKINDNDIQITNPNIEMMKCILTNEKDEMINFIRHSDANTVYDHIYTMCAFDIAYELLMSHLFMNDETAGVVVSHPNIMTEIIKRFDEDDDVELTPEYMCSLIHDVIDTIDD